MKTIPLLPALLLIAIGLAAPVRAQEGWLIPFAAAYQPGLTDFRTALADNNLPVPADRQYGWGIGLRSLTGGFLIGPMYLRTWSDDETPDYRLRAETNALFGEIGYKIAPARWLTIVPMLGIGGLGQSLNLLSRTDDLPLDSLLQSPGRDASIRTGLKFAGLASLELGLAVPTTTGSYGIATRIGYLYSPVAPNWHLANGARLTGAPTTSLNGPFLTIGLLILPAAEVSSTRLREQQ